MDMSFNLEKYLNKGIEKLVKNAVKASLKNPEAGAFFIKFTLSAKKAEGIRKKLGESGEHIPPFLIASITGSCNLRCAGCYHHAGGPCAEDDMSTKQWDKIFTEAEELGVTAVLLAGGEPLLRQDVLESASMHQSILFPVFTNGTLMEEPVKMLFKKNRNLIPIISIEGDKARTDSRRGSGVYDKTAAAMKSLNEHGLLFGVSITVTSENIDEVTGGGMLADLYEKGCRAVIFVEYVPVEAPSLALDDSDRRRLEENVSILRESSDMIIISFPGDEKKSGGCLAAGRGFFHINSGGGAEPCPFSPYSDTSLKNTTLREALQSPLFTSLKLDGSLTKEHTGGCTLFDRAEHVKNLAVKKD